MQNKQLVMYTRSTFLCPYVSIAERVFHKHNIDYITVDIDTNEEARQRVLNWTGFMSVPTIVVANEGEVLPYETQAPLNGDSPRGVDRGTMITEPSGKLLETWLKKHGFIAQQAPAN